MTYLSHHPISPHSHLKTHDFVSCKTKTTKRQESIQNLISFSLSHFIKHSSEIHLFIHSFANWGKEKKIYRREKWRWECWGYYVWWCWCWFYVCPHHHHHHQLHILGKRIEGALYYQNQYQYKQRHHHWGSTELGPPLCFLFMGTCILLGMYCIILFLPTYSFYVSQKTD